MSVPKEPGPWARYLAIARRLSLPRGLQSHAELAAPSKRRTGELFLTQPFSHTCQRVPPYTCTQRNAPHPEMTCILSGIHACSIDRHQHVFSASIPVSIYTYITHMHSKVPTTYRHTQTQLRFHTRRCRYSHTYLVTQHRHEHI